MKFIGKGQPLTRAGLSQVLVTLGLGANDAAHIWTVVEVETAGLTQGFGFRVDRRPQILFERHIFRKYTDGRFDDVAPDISGPAGGYGLISEQYGKLEKALGLCTKAKSCTSGKAGGLNCEPLKAVWPDYAGMRVTRTSLVDRADGLLSPVP